MKERVIGFLKKETVLVVAMILAVISAFFVHPSREYADYIDFRVLGILLTLMIIMEGLTKNGFFDAIGERLLNKTRHIWQLVLVLVFLCFFLSMLITNDVALIAFVPFAILMLQKSGHPELTVSVVVLQTLAANIGSMLTPIGNPQNLYLYNLSEKSIGEFIRLMMVYAVLGGVLLLISILLLKGKKEPVVYENAPKKPIRGQTRRKIVIYILLFIFAVLVVARIFPWQYVLAATALMTFVLDADVLKKVDYLLLLTFVAFFIFTGNIARIPEISSWLQQIVGGHEVPVAVLSSQVISNVPAALLLSGFTDAYDELIVGVNLGGMGTLIASMASLISYKLFAASYPKQKGRYFRHFTMVSVVYLLLFFGCYLVIKYI